MTQMLLRGDRLQDAADRLLSWFTGHGHVLVAFSGGADSALVLAAAERSLGPENVLAVTAVSDSLAHGEADFAESFARELGVEHVRARTREIDVEGYRANDGNRCYFCKSTL